MNEQKPTVCVSLERKINLGDYNSAGVSIMLCGVPVGSTDTDIAALMDTAALTFKAIQPALAAKVAECKQTHWEKVMGTQEN